MVRPGFIFSTHCLCSVWDDFSIKLRWKCEITAFAVARFRQPTGQQGIPAIYTIWWQWHGKNWCCFINTGLVWCSATGSHTSLSYGLSDGLQYFASFSAYCFLMVKWPRCWLQLCRQYVLLLHDVHDNTTRDPNGARKCLGLQVWQSKWHVTGPSSQRNQERYIQVRTSTHEITWVHTSHLNLTHPDINFTNFDQPPRTALITCELALDDDDHSKSLHDDVVSNQASQDWFGQSPIVPKLPKNTSKTQSGQWQNSTWFPYVILLPSGFRLASPILRLRQCACPFLTDFLENTEPKVFGGRICKPLATAAKFGCCQ